MVETGRSHEDNKSRTDGKDASLEQLRLANVESSLAFLSQLQDVRKQSATEKFPAPGQPAAEVKTNAAERSAAATAQPVMEVKGSRDGERYELHHNSKGEVDKVIVSVGGSVRDELQAGKDFKPGSLSVSSDNSIKVKTMDGRHSLTLGADLSRVTKELGDKPDGSGDKVVQVITAQGVQRDLTWEPVPGGPAGAKQIKTIKDTLHTAGGDLVETTTRKDGGLFELTTNYGRRASRMNVAVSDNGDFKYTQLEVPKISRPNDIADARGSVTEARKHFVEVAAKHGMSKTDMNEWGRNFELRCYQSAHYGLAQPSDEQMRKVYREAELILEGKNHTVSEANRKKLVKEGLQALARPLEYVNQFQHPSCAFAATQNIVGMPNPGDQMRAIREMVNDGKFVSKEPVSNGNRMVVKFSDKQLTPHADWPNAYYSQLCQTLAIKLAYPGYTECGEDGTFPGGNKDQMAKVKKWITGKEHLLIVGNDGYNGSNASFSTVQKELKQNGPIGFVIPGHMMCIAGARVKNGVQQVLVKNTWGQQGEKNSMGTGWVEFSRI